MKIEVQIGEIRLSYNVTQWINFLNYGRYAVKNSADLM